MNYMLTTERPQDPVLLRKAEIWSILEEICAALDLTETQYEAAMKSYEAVADWLSGSDDPVLQHIEV